MGRIHQLWTSIHLQRLCLVLLLVGLPASAQDRNSGSAQGHRNASANDTCGAKHLKQCVADILHDQAGIWTSPLRLHASDAAWLVPFAGATGAAFASDSDALNQLGTDQHRVNVSNTFSDFGSPEATIGEGIGLYALGSFTKNPKLSETGRLGAEAVVDASIVSEAVKLIAQRERPDEGGHNGEFWPSGTRNFSLNSSFPSGHATAVWALARVVGEEYHGVLPQLFAYGFATAISIARVTGRDHFPSDVLVGGGIGFLTGGYVYRHHSEQQENRVSVEPLLDIRSRTAGVQITTPIDAVTKFLRRRY